MTERDETDTSPGKLRPSTHPWPPRLGDLVRDSSTDRTAVVVALPGDHGPDALTYHLALPGDVDTWSVPGDASTLSPTEDLPPPSLSA